MKKLIGLLFLTFLQACSPFGQESKIESTLKCQSIPSVSPNVLNNSCPGNVETWNQYEAIYNLDGSIQSMNLTCGLTDNVIPAEQSQFDIEIQSNASMSNADFEMNQDCGSASYISLSNQKIQYIWRKIH